MNNSSIKFIDNSSIKGREEKFVTLTVNSAKILKSWKSSLFSFEWLTPDGKVRSPDELGKIEQEKFHNITALYQKGDALERPLLGIGVLDNIEIGSRRDIFLTLCAYDVPEISVHVLKQDEKEFDDYLTR